MIIFLILREGFFQQCSVFIFRYYRFQNVNDLISNEFLNFLVDYIYMKLLNLVIKKMRTQY